MTENQDHRGRSGRAAVIGVIAAAGMAVVIGGSAAASGGGTPKAGQSAGPVPRPMPPPTGTPAAPPKPAEPRLTSIPHITKRGQVVAMPLAPYTTSMSDLKLFDTATALKASDCMRSLGFQNWTPDTVSHAGPSTYQEFQPLDYLDPTTVARSGYPQTLVDKEGTRANAAAAKPSEDGVRAFVGAAPRTQAGAAVPRGGCDGVAAREVKGATVTELPVNARVLADLAEGYSIGDSRMKKAIATWSGCMARQGLHYANPLSAQNDPRWGRRTRATPADATEKHVAAIDARCQNDINLIGTFKALQIGYQRQLITANTTKLKAAKAIADRWVANARAVMENK